MTRKITTEQFIEKCKLKHASDNYIYDKVIYSSNAKKVIIVCSVHGEFAQLAANHLKGSGCPKCANAIRNRNNKRNHQQAIDELKERNMKYPPVMFRGDSEYSNARTPIEWCCERNHTWKAKFGDIMNGHGCPVCAIQTREQTNLDKYGVKYVTQKHLSSDVLEKLGDTKFLSSEHAKEKTLEAIALDLGVTPKVISNKFKKFQLPTVRFPNSQPERDLADFLSEHNIQYISNSRSVITPHELDLYVPESNFAIEYNGIRWHSELQGKTKKYHLNKTNACLDKGITLVHISEPEWMEKKDIVKSMILSRLNKTPLIIGARKCKVIIISKEEAKRFLDTNHIQGYIASTINIGLEYDGELVSLMTLSKSRFSKRCEYEIYRFCNIIDASVVGAASKLFNHFVKQYKPSSVVTYADRRFGEGYVYENLGFTFKHNSLPNYKYFKQNQLQLQSRIKFQKHKLSTTLESFDPQKTEWQNMVDNRYDRIWDCGNAVWEWFPS